MILLCDEDVGTGVPRALAWVGYSAHSLYDCGLANTPDTDWLTIAGRGGLLVFSRNRRMLRVPHERQTIVDERVGIVFLTTGEESPATMLRVLLNRWNALELLDSTLPKPFARFLTPRGQLLHSHRNLRL